MMTEKQEETQRVLLLLKIDSENLYERIKHRKTEYINTFSMKRTRDHFHDIFENRYSSVDVNDLKLCSVDVISALDKFYTKVESFYWYLKHTEDMPTLVTDKIERFVRELDHEYDILRLYIDAEFSVSSENESLMDVSIFEESSEIEEALDSND